MLSGLSSLLFGSGASDDAAVDQTQASQAVDLSTQDGEMGWVLVDVTETSGRVPGEKENVAALTRLPEEGEKVRHHHYRCTCVRNFTSPMYSVDSCRCGVVEGEGHSDSDRENLDVAMDVELRDRMHEPRLFNLLGESWIMTPPPCFTGTGGVSQLESSPLENLLIEHPSMSVYRHCRHVLHEEDEEEEEGNQQESLSDHRQGVQPGLRPLAASNNSNIVRQQSPHLARAVRACAGAVEQMKQARFQQRRQHASAGKQLNKKYMERSNKVRLVQSSCRKHLSAINRTSRPSCCMNGRRSQRVH